MNRILTAGLLVSAMAGAVLAAGDVPKLKHDGASVESTAFGARNCRCTARGRRPLLHVPRP